MQLLTLKIEDWRYIRLEMAAKRSGLTLEQFILDAAEECITQSEMFNSIKKLAEQRDTRAGFDRLLASVPDADPIYPDDVIK